VVKQEEESGSGGGGMTIWWLCLTVIVFLATLVTEGSILPSASHSSNMHNDVWVWWMKLLSFLRAVSATSGLCVCLGYYTFMIGFNVTQKSSLTSQLHEKMPQLSLPMYIMLDLFVHVFCCLGVLIVWSNQLTAVGAFGAFLYHRIWSIFHSYRHGPTLYYIGDHIYGFKHQVKDWVWVSMYTCETVTWIGVLIFCVIRHRYYM